MSSESLQNFIKRLFGIKTETRDSESLIKKVVKPFTRHLIASRQPYFIQIGLDFGTSYSKCIYRDMMTQKAWVHIPAENHGRELPFLIPGIVILQNGTISCLNDPEQQYPANGLYHLKNALAKLALNEWTSPILESYQKVTGSLDREHLSRLIENCAVYFMAKILCEVRSKIRQQFPGFGSHVQDYMAVNLAVPVGEVERFEVNKLFHKILVDAWLIADGLTGRSSMELKEVEDMRVEQRNNWNQTIDDSCYVYPEVSANVQGFVRSRLSGEGIYMFSDTGASTVDQSVFIFRRLNKIETLTYLCGRVLPIGSGQIEFLAAEASGKTDREYLEVLRKLKEIDDNTAELLRARKIIEKELYRETERTLANAKIKLCVKDELKRIRIIFGGGGHCDNPYKRAVM